MAFRTSPLPRLRAPHIPLLAPHPQAGLLAAFPWRAAAAAGPLLLADGSRAAEQQTAVRVAWSEAGLWLRFDCADRDAWGTQQERNAPIYLEEAVEVFLAPGEADPIDYWEVEVSPLGTLFAARIHNPTGLREDLVADTSWAAEGLAWAAGPAASAPAAKTPAAAAPTSVAATSAGAGAQDWWAALVIPWAALGIIGATSTAAPAGAAPPRLWRANFYRIERPRDGGAAEFSCWSPTLTAPANFHRPERFGFVELVGSP